MPCLVLTLLPRLNGRIYVDVPLTTSFLCAIQTALETSIFGTFVVDISHRFYVETESLVKHCFLNYCFIIYKYPNLNYLCCVQYIMNLLFCNI